MESHYDIVVVGAGLQGLAAAKTYIQIEPEVNLRILDSSDSIGGVWAKSNLYPGLRSNNLFGTYEYTDFPMTKQAGVANEEHIPGGVIHGYLLRYAERHGLLSRIELKTKVSTAEKVREGWKLGLRSTSSKKSEDSTRVNHRTITCTKLIIATGITSSPRPIDIPTDSIFEAPVYSFAKFRQEAPKLLADPSCHHVAIYGGSKSAHDAAYILASQGKRVSWIIRSSGHGPAWMAPAHVYLGPFKCQFEKATASRLFTLFSPCVWGHYDGFGWIRSLLHGTSVGRWLVDKFWKKLASSVIEQTGLKSHPELRKLIPDQPAFWYGTTFSLLTYPTSIYDYVRNGAINIMRKDINGLSKSREISFSDGTKLEVDALVCATGWQCTPDIDFLPRSIHSDLGIPSDAHSELEVRMRHQLDQNVDLEILDRFPYLATGPRVIPIGTSADQESQPSLSNTEKVCAEPNRDQVPQWRLWRGIAPPGPMDSSIVFLGMILNIQAPLRAEISSLWAYAYLNDKLSNTDPITARWSPTVLKHMTHLGIAPNWRKYDTALFNRFGRWRYPMGYGLHFPDIVFDGIPYFDLLLYDLGLRQWRKGWGWLGELFGGPYGQEEYKGLVGEWVEKEKRRRKDLKARSCDS